MIRYYTVRGPDGHVLPPVEKTPHVIIQQRKHHTLLYNRENTTRYYTVRGPDGLVLPPVEKKQHVIIQQRKHNTLLYREGS